MAFRPRKWLDRVTRERAYRGWSELAVSGEGLGMARKRLLREHAFALRRKLDLFLIRTDRRNELAREELDALHLPVGTDWRWRPDFLSAQIRPSALPRRKTARRLGVRRRSGTIAPNVR
nr:DUF6478 family protein [uncultured Paracoccus sp.]